MSPSPLSLGDSVSPPIMSYVPDGGIIKNNNIKKLHILKNCSPDQIDPANTPLLVQYCYIYAVFGGKRVFMQHLMGLREFAQRANTRHFVGPFTTSCEAQTRIVTFVAIAKVVVCSLRQL